MSNPTQPDPHVISDAEGDAPSVEPWAKVAMAAFVPLVLAFYLPIALQPYLFVTGAALVVWSIVMLVRQQRRENAQMSA